MALSIMLAAVVAAQAPARAAPSKLEDPPVLAETVREADSGSPVEEQLSPLPFEMIFTGPTAQMDALENELRREGWKIVARADASGTAFLEASIVLQETMMPEILEKLGTGEYSSIRSGYVSPTIGLVGDGAR